MNIQEYIYEKYPKYRISKKKKTLEQICYPKEFKLQIPQEFPAQIINPKTSYTGLLIYYEIGSGKTCTAIQIAKNFKKKIIVLPASLEGNFRSELRSECAHGYITNNEKELLKILNPSSIEYKKIIEDSNKKINKDYIIYSYNKFSSLIKENNINLDNNLLIIDEIQNMISESGIYYKLLYDVITNSNNLKLVIMTATPIFDKPVEIALTMNLLIKDKLPIGEEFDETFLDINGKKIKTKNMELFKKYINGYVTYYRGAPPEAYPKSKIIISKVNMSEKQEKLYKKVIKQEEINSFLIRTRMISNIVYPNNEFGEEGYKSLKKLDLEHMKIYSPKFVKIFKRIKKCSGTVFVYSTFREYGGIKPFVDFITYNGYKDYNKYGSGKKRFAVWSGDENLIYKNEIKEIFNNKNNEFGSKIKIMCGSPAIKEGVSFYRVQQVHIIEPYWNWSRLNQVIGRAIRYCSHRDVPFENQFVKIFIYLAVSPNIKITVDQHILQLAIEKKIINGSFETALKEAAIDCLLFKEGNGDIKCNI